MASANVANRAVAAAFDVVVVGSGAAGLTAALAAAVAGASVLVLERSPLLGGTSAISGGQIWSPLNGLMTLAGHPDDPAAALRYLERVTMGEVPRARLQAFVSRSPSLLDFLERRSELRFFRIDRPDYHPDFPGAMDGRSFEPLPYETRRLGPWGDRVRASPTRPPLTSLEARLGLDPVAVDRRRVDGVRTQGAALVAGLAQACLDHGVAFQTNARVLNAVTRDRTVIGCEWIDAASGDRREAMGEVVLACGGFEWNQDLKRAFLSPADEAPTSPPWNEGDGLALALALGAGVAHMGQAWWTAAVRVPGEDYDGRPFYRNIVRELALPGSIMVNQGGCRFVNEASSYHDLGKAFQRFDPGRYTYPNRIAWLVFDHAFKTKYQVVNVRPADPAPSWFESARGLEGLADRIDVDPLKLVATVERFNAGAVAGLDIDYKRGADRHGLTYGDPSHRPNPCLGPLAEPPFYAIRILHGNNGTKGGLATDADGRVTRLDGSPIPGLWACGNVAASPMGPGYPGTGASLGPSMTEALALGAAVAAKARGMTR